MSANFHPSLGDFKKLAEGANLVPVYVELLADVETPVSVYSRFAEDEYSFLLESVEGGTQWGRYSIIGVEPKGIFSVEDGKAKFIENGNQKNIENGFFGLRELMDDIKPASVSDLPRFYAGAVGFLGYETVGEFEKLPAPKVSGDGFISCCMMMSETTIIFDNVRHTIKIVASVRTEDFESIEDAYNSGMAKINKIQERLKVPPQISDDEIDDSPIVMKSNMTQDEFCNMARTAKEHIVEGDVIQVVLSQRFSAKRTASALNIYRALRLINPSPYTFMVKLGDKILAGSSPEVMVRRTGTAALLRPIAGTRPRGATEQEDRELADDLLKDEKERAEHVMLVDLGRNDLGRIAMPGSVQVKDFMSIEKYSHVMHIVSTVQAELKDEFDSLDLIKAVFPAGTLSGAPKIRAMEIINNLETTTRGAYGGAVGYIGYDDNMDIAITIRTVEIDGDEVAVQAGAGIVYDSIPQKEFEETCHKSKGMVKALEMAANGLKI
jgi:anthranilate synthase component 1